MGRPKLPAALLRVPVTVTLEKGNLTWLASQAHSDDGDLTAAVDFVVRHLRSCPDATVASPLPERVHKHKVSFRLDPSNMAWIRQERRNRRFASDAHAIDYAIGHARACKR